MPRVVGLGGVQQARVDRRLVHLLGQALQLLDGGQEQPGGRAAWGVDLAAVGGLEGPGALQGAFEVAVDLRVLDGLVQIAQVPRDSGGAAAALNGLDHGWPPSGMNAPRYVRWGGAADKGPANPL